MAATPANLPAVADCLDKAANVIARQGWTTDELVSFRDEVCVLGAITQSTGLGPLDWRYLPTILAEAGVHALRARRALEAAAAFAESLEVLTELDLDDPQPTLIHDQLTEAVGSEWNDRDGQTADAVMAALRAAAEKARSTS